MKKGHGYGNIHSIEEQLELGKRGGQTVSPEFQLLSLLFKLTHWLPSLGKEKDPDTRPFPLELEPARTMVVCSPTLDSPGRLGIWGHVASPEASGSEMSLCPP